MEELNRRLAAGEVVVIDGATGTELQARGVPMDEAAWCGVANLEYRDAVRDVHEDYIRAGTAVVIANTFSTDRSRLEEAGVGDRVAEVNRPAVVVMRTDVADVDEALEAVFRHWYGVVGVYPHVGDFAPPDWQFDESFTPDDLVRHTRRWVGRGVRIVGGCCGLCPAHIRA